MDIYIYTNVNTFINANDVNQILENIIKYTGLQDE